MVTIKEIAKSVGFSPSTVSIVLSGKAESRKISDDTRNKILEAAQTLGYRVNVAARRLRLFNNVRTLVTVFMAMDQRAYMMTRFLLSLQRAAEEHNQPVEISVHFYKSGALRLFKETIELTNGAIICNADSEDIAFLENTDFYVPIVLYYRESKKYCSVNSDHFQMGGMAAEIFARRGRKHAVLMHTDAYFIGMEQCASQFIHIANAHGMAVTQVFNIQRMSGGYQGGLTIGSMRPMPDCLFTRSNAMAIGALRAFSQQGIKVPDQIEIISIGIDSTELEEYASISISSLHVSVEEMAKECIRLLFMQLDGLIDSPCTVQIPVVYVSRESCGP